MTRYIYKEVNHREINSTADWIAAYTVKHGDTVERRNWNEITPRTYLGGSETDASGYIYFRAL